MQLIFLPILFTCFLLLNAAFTYQTKNVDPGFWSSFKYQLILVPVFFGINILMGLAYKLGYKYFSDMTFVFAAAKVVEILAILLVTYFFFKEIPNWKTLLGFSLIVIGAILVKPN